MQRNIKNLTILKFNNPKQFLMRLKFSKITVTKLN